MRKAWELFKNQSVRTDETFSNCLKLAWSIAKKLQTLPTFNELYKEHKSMVMSQLRQKIKNESVCEELCNDVFLKVNEILSTFNCEKAKFSTWIYTFVKNKIIDYYRSEGKKAQQTASVSDFVNSEGQEAFSFISDNNASNSVECAELQSKIDLALNNLKPIYKQIAEMFYVEQLKYEEIAERLNVPMGTVKGTLLRAKVMLQNSLQAEYQAL
jgi:RNA polymerase sigma-70 factor (ECF subfamily)